MAKIGDDSLQSILDEIEGAAREAADCYFADLYSASHNPADKPPAQSVGRLVEKLAIDPDGDFPVSEHSSYCESRWVLLRSEGFRDVSVRFDSVRADLQGLKRALCYYLLPPFHPMGTIQSFRSSETYAQAFGYLEKYLFEANYLSSTPDHLGLVTAGMLNSALDTARDSGVSRAYTLLYFHINLWILLSSERLLPEGFCIDVDLKDVDTLQRREDIQMLVRSKFVGWKPFSEDELRDLLSYAFYWIDKGLPVIADVLAYCSVRPDTGKKYYIRTGEKDLAFENVLGRKINGMEIVGFTCTPFRITQKSSSGRDLYYDAFRYTWRRHYQYAVDRVRNAISILFFLMTGLRKRELAPLKFEDVYRKESDGLWYLSFVRFKTSADANYFGEVDEIPLPAYLGNAIDSYRKLREYGRYMLKGYIFQPITPSHELNLTDRMIEKLASALAREVGVDGIHAHRFRKTIAEILINKSERNLDLVRMLFGHRSYTMGLRYIARNPFLVSSVVETLKEHFAQDFVDILQSVSSGVYAGEAANKLATQVCGRPELFVGKLLKTTIYQYVTHMFEGGEAYFVQRTALSTFCMSGLIYKMEELPPCLAGRTNLVYPASPDASNCQISCPRNLVLGSAASSIEQNLRFYRAIKSQADKLSHAALLELDKKIDINERMLEELSQQKGLTDEGTCHKL